MKHIHYIIGTLIALILLSSCEFNEGTEEFGSKTDAGYYAYETVRHEIEDDLFRLQMAQNIDICLQAKASERDSIQSVFMPDYSFETKNDSIVLTTKDLAWVVVRSSTDSLHLPNVSWCMGYY